MISCGLAHSRRRYGPQGFCALGEHPNTAPWAVPPYRLSSRLYYCPAMTTRTDHLDGHRFFNPNGANGQTFWRVPQLLVTPFTRWPSKVSVEPRRPPTAGPGEGVVTFIGHAAFLIQAAGTNVLIDPVYAERASPLWFAGPRRARAPGTTTTATSRPCG